VVIDAGEGGWKEAVGSLRAARLLAPADPNLPEALDTHPLVREWFGQRLKQGNESVWKAAHRRLFDHLQSSTKEGPEPTLKELEPLYQAIAHGCRAGRYQAALDRVYIDRICRRDLNGRIEFHASKKLALYGIGLAAVSWFFETAYSTPAAKLRPSSRSFVSCEAALGLVSQGRLAEALLVLRGVMQMEEGAQRWRNSAVASANLCNAELSVGQIDNALATAKRGILHADRSGDSFQAFSRRANYAVALCAVGRVDEAEAAFNEAEQKQAQASQYPILYSFRGYQFCRLLIEKGNYSEAKERTSKTIKWAEERRFLLDLALDTLTLGRACLGLALSSRPELARAGGEPRSSKVYLEKAIDRLREAGQLDEVPPSFLARACFYRNIGDWVRGSRDLDEVEEIAEPGPMKLYLCDMALERARLALAQVEAFAPLNGLLEDSPPPPVVPDAAGATRLKAEAARQVAIAADYIKTCGYHLRDTALAELQAVLRGECRFADLPPRV
jgi:tetratricopeptide (TPR) repeat protein